MHLMTEFESQLMLPDYSDYQVVAMLGLDRGDEGKGRFTDLYASSGFFNIVARGQGGANAGHTVVIPGMEPFSLHQVPSGIANPDMFNVIGGGVFLDVERLADEIDELVSRGVNVMPLVNLMISESAHLVLPHHILLDERREGRSERAQGSTKSGIAFVAADKYLREGVRAEDLNDPTKLREKVIDSLHAVHVGPRPWKRRQYSAIADRVLRAAEIIGPYVGPTHEELADRLRDGDRLIAEGAQGYQLDINSGMYPMVTSSSITVNGLMDGVGVPMTRYPTKGIGVTKLTRSHVGGGPFVTEIDESINPELVKQLRGPEGAADSEYGRTTGRPRRMGYPDFPSTLTAIEQTGVTEVIISKMDLVERFNYGEESGLRAAICHSFDGSDKVSTRAAISAIELDDSTPIYQKFDSWSGQAIVESANGESLPGDAQIFVDTFEDHIRDLAKITMLGVGYEREQIVVL